MNALPIDYEQCCADQLNPQHIADNPPLGVNRTLITRAAGYGYSSLKFAVPSHKFPDRSK
jgi:hypothetical protein